MSHAHRPMARILFKLEQSLIVISLALVALPAQAAGITEDFKTNPGSSDGLTFGVCKQLVLRIAGGGRLDVSGGTANLVTDDPSQAAMLGSALPMPAAPYTVKVSDITWRADLTIAAGLNDIAAAARHSTAWRNHALVEVAGIRDGNDNLIYINYWDASKEVYSWSAKDKTWRKGVYLPAIIYNPAGASFDITIERSAAEYTLVVASAGSEITRASVKASEVGTQPKVYFASGDLITDDHFGTQSIGAIELPRPAGCGGGPKPPNPPPAQDASPSAADSGPGPSADAAPTTPDAGAPASDGSVPTSFDLGLTKPPPRADGPEDGCALGGTMTARGLVPTLALLGLLLLFGRRRRRP